MKKRMYIILFFLVFMSIVLSGCEIEEHIMFKDIESITRQDEDTFPREINVKYYVKKDAAIDGKDHLFAFRFGKTAKGFDYYEVFPVKKEKDEYEIIGEEKLEGYVLKDIEEMGFRKPISLEGKEGTIKMHFVSYKQYEAFLSYRPDEWERVNDYYKKNK